MSEKIQKVVSDHFVSVLIFLAFVLIVSPSAGGRIMDHYFPPKAETNSETMLDTITHLTNLMKRVDRNIGYIRSDVEMHDRRLGSLESWRRFKESSMMFGPNEGP